MQIAESRSKQFLTRKAFTAATGCFAMMGFTSTCWGAIVPYISEKNNFSISLSGIIYGEPIGGVGVCALVGVVDGFVVGEFDGVGVTVDLVAEVVVALLVGLAELPGLAGIVNLVPTTSAAGSSPMDFLLAS